MTKKDERLSPETFDTYRAWLKYIRKAHPKLSEGLVKNTLYSYCAAMASDGANGLGCYTSDATIAEDLELYDYRSIAPYRHEALRLGWFVWTGKMHGRSQVLDIAIPEVATFGVKVSTEVEHDTSTSPAMCPACQRYRKPVAEQRMTVAEVLEIHQGLGVSDA